MIKLIFVFAASYLCAFGASTTNTVNANDPRQDNAPPKDSPKLASAKRTPASNSPNKDLSATSTSVNTTSSKWWGDVELRPSWLTKGGIWDTENTAELGYKHAPNRLFAYTQYFVTALYNPNPSSSAKVYLQDGFFRYKMQNLWVSDDKTLSFSWEPRIYLPTDPGLRRAGLIAYNRQYVSLAKKLRENLTLTFMDVGILHGYNRAGNSINGSDVANPIVENREYIILDASFFSGFVDVSMNILINHCLTRNYSPTAKNNNRVVHMVWTWPEIDLNVAPHTVVGLSYYSDNFIKDDFSGFTLGDGLEKGVVQLVFRATL